MARSTEAGGAEGASMAGRIVIVAYRPKAGREETLRRLVREHVPRLRAQGLVTEREPVLMEAADGTVVEVFEWASKEAIEAAHTHPAVQALWGEFAAVCDYVPVGRLSEAGELFTELAPLPPPAD
ncbi:MAG TPA: antibiotic biosynthesis monooxygenase [Polyangiaceae bacterium LLY-WYZ-15_(1-7)]|nr:antibiotic biosynthesis monooxygenase [Polyangiaceae bacterium LLY-WYZ-15_(1-7)]HJL11264.1 antibiotic biosynthesis monooxygenase [Polyangiaceae bacterium LLY-WYZ-15_(1-7)]HJL36944.1 antibiotic biosynthesis monooxygenase [Polyangiaceae bacterium LLY-WYZ-15_(1-7)]